MFKNANIRTMKMRCNSKIFLLTVFLVLIQVVFMSNNTYAAGGDAGSGYNPSGNGKCRGNVGERHWDTCFGVSWVLYKIDRDQVTGSFKMPGGGNAPGKEISALCTDVGQFYHLGYEMYRIGETSDEDESLGIQIGTAQIGNIGGTSSDGRTMPNWGETRFFVGSDSKLRSNDLSNYDYPTSITPRFLPNGVTAVEYTTWDDAKKVFNAMRTHHPTFIPDGLEWKDDSTLGWFCYDPNTEQVTNSRVASGGEYKQSLEMKKDETGRYKRNAMASMDALDIKVGEKTSLSFAHNVLSYGKAITDRGEELQFSWTVERTVYFNDVDYSFDDLENQGYYNIPDGKDECSNGVCKSANSTDRTVDSNKPVLFTHLIEEQDASTEVPKEWRIGMYTVEFENRPYQNNNGTRFVHRDVYNDIEFYKAGSYRFCEKITLYRMPEKSEKASSSACRTINVTGKVANYPISGVNVGTDQQKIKETNGGTTTTVNDEVEVNVGEEVPVKFLHNIFSTIPQTEKTEYVIQSTFTGKNGTDYEVNGLESKTVNGSGIINSKEKNNVIYGMKNRVMDYVISESGPGGNRQFIRVNSGTVTFNNPGTYKFCEMITITSEEPRRSSKACKTITAKDDASEYMSRSRVSKGTNTSSGSTQTSIASSGSVTDTVNIKKGETIRVAFAHNIFASKKISSSVKWKLTRTDAIYSPSSNYTLKATGPSDYSTGESGSSTAGSNPINVSQDGRYTTERQYKNSSGTAFLVRDVYDITFNQNGSYQFCETITVAEGKASTTACKTVNVNENGGNDDDGDDDGGDPTPEQPSQGSCPGLTAMTQSGTEGHVQVSSSVQNVSIGSGPSSLVYAKPGDQVEFNNCYYPGVQATANTEVTNPIHSPSDSNQHPVRDRTGSNAYKSKNYYDKNSEGQRFEQEVSGQLVTKPISTVISWQNQYTISASNFDSYNSGTKTFTFGDYGVKTLADQHWVLPSEVGKTLNETIESGYPTQVKINEPSSHSWMCLDAQYKEKIPEDDPEYDPEGLPEQYKYIDADLDCTHQYVTFAYNNDRKNATSSVVVPYNYINTNTTSFLTNKAYTGETATIEVNVVNQKRQNNTTNGFYATKSPNTQARLYTFYSDWDQSFTNGHTSYSDDSCSGSDRQDCNQVAFASKDINDSSNIDGSEERVIVNAFPIKDVGAGKYFCAVAAVYPATSGYDTNMSTNGDGQWYIGQPVCKVIAKKPSFQIWGGSLFSNGLIQASVSNKIPAGYSSTRSFGSWSEQGIITNYGTIGMATGAAYGYTSNLNGNLTLDPGGSASTDYCKNIPLTFPNNCVSGSNKNARLGATNGLGSFRNAIYSSFVASKNLKVVNDTSIDLANAAYYNEDDDTRYTQLNGANTRIVSSMPLSITKSHVIYSTGTITIGSNLLYEDQVYTNPNQIPEYVIYAKSINIECGVQEVNAWLVTEGTINTCSDVSDVNAAGRSNQLVINGVIVADKIDLGRTYGAGTGKYSAIPAEIIKLSPFAQLYSKSESTEKPTIYTTYRRELAPRY